jgi:hypothetical protein
VDLYSLPTEPDVSAAADVVREFGHYAGRRFYSGVVADPASASIRVHRVPNADFDGEVLALVAPGVALAFVDAVHTREELSTARETVWLLGDTLGVLSVSLPQDGSRLGVLVSDEAHVAEAQRVLDDLAPGLTRVDAGSSITT